MESSGEQIDSTLKLHYNTRFGVHNDISVITEQHYNEVLIIIIILDPQRVLCIKSISSGSHACRAVVPNLWPAGQKWPARPQKVALDLLKNFKNICTKTAKLLILTG